MSDRDLTQEDRHLKVLARLLIERVGGLDAAAAVTRGRVGRAQLGNYTNLNADQFMPVDVMLRLEEVAGENLLLHELARRSGFRLIPLDDAPEAELAAAVADHAMQGADVATKFCKAIGDGHVTPAEASDIQREALEAAAAATRVAAAAGQMVRRTPAPAAVAGRLA